jgi:FlaA1/EpsC-like NDP-sugar epimerase
MSSLFFSRTFTRKFSTSLYKMAPQHKKAAIIGSGPAGKILAIK